MKIQITRLITSPSRTLKRRHGCTRCAHPAADVAARTIECGRAAGRGRRAHAVAARVVVADAAVAERNSRANAAAIGGVEAGLLLCKRWRGRQGERESDGGRELHRGPFRFRAVALPARPVRCCHRRARRGGLVPPAH